jgi:4-amino-4-deoxy-L-arabinose transferase-like glycosyltransferase
MTFTPRTAPAPATAMATAPAELRAEVLGADAPWRTGDLLLAAGLAAAGLTGLALTWYGASDQPDWADQLPWASLGVAATTIALLGLVSWLVAGLRRVRRLRREVLPLLAANAAPRRSASGAAVTAIGTALVTAPGMTRYHRPACPLAAGKPVQSVRPVRPDEADGAGLVPCGVCAA